jgi:type VI secretion system protein VasG
MEAPMADINLEAVAGKLNRIGYEALFKALRQAKGAGNRNVEFAHWLVHVLQGERTDIVLTADHFGLDRNRLLTDINAAVAGFRKNETDMPTVSNTVMDLLDRGWHYATLFFGETQIRTGHVLVGAMQSRELDRALKNISPEFAKMSINVLTSEYRKIWATSEEQTLRPMDGSGLGSAAGAAEQTGGVKGTTPLDRFSQDLTAKAKAGEMDPILGRDNEIRS